jgi:hypothetical protein
VPAIDAAHVPRAVVRDWRDLAAPTADQRPFDPEAAVSLPPPAARWARHAIETGAPLRRVALLDMHGEIRIGRWQPFTARQLISPSGFVWAARVGRWPLRIRGFDRYSRGTGELRWRLIGLVPVMTATGDDITRSSAGRLAAEQMLVPATALDDAVSWEPVDDRRATAHVDVDGTDHRVTIDVDDHGALQSVSQDRWGDPDGGEFAVHPFGATFADERTFDGCTIPTTLYAGWSFGTGSWPDGVFFRATIDDARFR